MVGRLSEAQQAQLYTGVAAAAVANHDGMLAVPYVVHAMRLVLDVLFCVELKLDHARNEKIDLLTLVLNDTWYLVRPIASTSTGSYVHS